MANYRFLDEVSLEKTDTSKPYTSKWWFYGTRSELENWLPDSGDAANFSLLDSDNPGLGNQWAPTGYKIKSVRATALNRFEYDVLITAENPTFKGNFNYPRDKSNLASKEQVEITKGSFTITSEYCGYKLNPGSFDYEDLSLTAGWTLANDCPFTARPAKNQVNTNIPTTILKQTVFLSGSPETHLAEYNAFKGVQTLKGQSGRVVESRMERVNNDGGAIYTMWTKAIMLPPSGYSWNSNWKGID